MTDGVQASLILCVGICSLCAVYTLYTVHNMKIDTVNTVHEDLNYYLRKDDLERFENFSDEEKERIIKYWNSKIAEKIQKLADDVNNLSKEDFIKLNNLIVRRGYDDSRN